MIEKENDAEILEKILNSIIYILANPMNNSWELLSCVYLQQSEYFDQMKDL